MLDDSDSGSVPRDGRTDRPVRDADRNRDLLERSGPATDDTLLPTLEDGITLLDVEGGRGVPILQSLVLDHLLLNDGPAFWVDADGHATTTSLARLAPGRRLLERIHVARGFTAYQHFGAVCDLPNAVDRPRHAAGEQSPRTPSLVVAPALDARYRSEDGLEDEHARTLQARVLARLSACARRYEAPVLVTRTAVDEFTAPIETAADHRLECERTRMGPRFVGEEFETLVYPADGGTCQTTLAYWRRVLEARAERVGLQPSPSPTAGDAEMGETTAPPTANPLLEAWTGTAGAGGW